MKWLGFVGLLAISTSAHAAKEPPPLEPMTPPDWSVVRQQVETRLLTQLVDPGSAKIAWPYGFRWGGYKPMLQKRVHGYVTCGTVNSKNRMGGYVGDSPFVVVYLDGAIRYFEIESATNKYNILASQCSSAALPSPQPELTVRHESGATEPVASIADELEKLATLRDKGIITQAEFDAQKAKLLAR